MPNKAASWRPVTAISHRTAELDGTFSGRHGRDLPCRKAGRGKGMSWYPFTRRASHRAGYCRRGAGRSFLSPGRRAPRRPIGLDPAQHGQAIATRDFRHVQRRDIKNGRTFWRPPRGSLPQLTRAAEATSAPKVRRHLRTPDKAALRRVSGHKEVCRNGACMVGLSVSAARLTRSGPVALRRRLTPVLLFSVSENLTRPGAHQQDRAPSGGLILPET